MTVSWWYRATGRACAIASVVAIAPAISACDGSRQPAARHDASLDLVEIDGERVALPHTQTVTCQDRGGEHYLFAWTGSDVMTPRRPLGDRFSSRVTVGFDADPPTAHTIDLSVYPSRKRVDLRWADTDATAATLDVNAAGGHTLIATLTGKGIPPQGRVARVQFHC